MATSSLHHPVPLALPTSPESGPALSGSSFDLATRFDIATRAERAIEAALDRAVGPGSPPRLAEALRYAVLPGGGRLRPQLCLVAALASGDRAPQAADAAAVAVELLHCASLVHDDLPCFDDADTRRGKPSVHAAFGEATALLVGDALIVQAFTELARGGATAALVAALGEAAGAARGIIAGQAWESEPAVTLDEYHRAKTASLFEAAASMGALAAGADPAPWRAFGEAIGRAYQAADDVADAAGDAEALGKPVGQDAMLGRPSVVSVSGLEGAKRRVKHHVRSAMQAVPPGPGETLVRAWAERFAARAGI
jgi:geranylgeranyl diphosphate synthase, type II